MDLAYVPIFVVFGLAVDWAFFARVHGAIAAYWPVKEGFGYRELLFLRVFLTVLSSAMVGVGSMDEPPNAELIIAGSVVFTLSALYAEYRVWRHGRLR